MLSSPREEHELLALAQWVFSNCYLALLPILILESVLVLSSVTAQQDLQHRDPLFSRVCIEHTRLPPGPCVQRLIFQDPEPAACGLEIFLLAAKDRKGAYSLHFSFLICEMEMMIIPSLLCRFYVRLKWKQACKAFGHLLVKKSLEIPGSHTSWVLENYQETWIHKFWTTAAGEIQSSLLWVSGNSNFTNRSIYNLLCVFLLTGILLNVCCWFINIELKAKCAVIPT